MTSLHEALRVLGEALGVEPHYTDNWGKVHRTDLLTMLRILEAKGVHVSPALCDSNAATLVVSAAVLPEKYSLWIADNRGDSSGQPATGTLELHATDGRETSCRCVFSEPELSVARDNANGLLGISMPFPRNLDTGEYRCHANVTVGGEQHQVSSRWFVCPGTAHIPDVLHAGRRLTGVAVALYGARSAKNWGIGDFGDLRQLIDWVRHDLGADFIGLNPLHALFNRRPYNSSPYLPSSRLYCNFLYLDVMAIPEFAESIPARAFVDSPTTAERIERLRAEEHVNYEEVADLKLTVLRDVFRTFTALHGSQESPTERWQAFDAYCRREGIYLDRFADFCALREHFSPGLPDGSTWRDWPRAYHDPASDDVRQFREVNPERVLFWKYIQWLIDEQLAGVQAYAREQGMAIGLYSDLALAVDRDGADFWAWRDSFIEGFRVGAPPDPFAPDGQDWGFPPPNGERLSSDGYSLFTEQLRANCRHAGGLRIDHVMQFHRLFWIPPGGTPADGVYVKDRENDLINLLVLESQRSGTLIVGEDLGTVPLDFRERLMSRGVFSYRLFYFERDRAGNLYSPHEYPRSAMVSITTHDLPTLAGFWCGLDIDLRRAIGQVDELEEAVFRKERTEHKAKIIEKLVRDGFLPAPVAHEAWESPFPTDELHSAVLRFLFTTPAALVVVNQEDVFLDTRQQNLPGTTWQRPNWVTKMRYLVEELQTDSEARRLSVKFRRLLQESGRS